jgi:hypothetical protein
VTTRIDALSLAPDFVINSTDRIAGPSLSIKNTTRDGETERIL